MEKQIHQKELEKDLEALDTEKEQIKKKIGRETSQRLFELIRMCHPNEKGEPYSRFDVIEEIDRRSKNLQILKELGWSCDLEHPYKNLFTGNTYKLGKLINKEPHKEEKMSEQGDEYHPQLWSIIEHYCPKEIWNENKCMDEYKGYRDGATNVFLKGGKYYFWGDISHCGKENIFTNAKLMKEQMLKKKDKAGHKNCDGPPTFDTKHYEKWEKQQFQRKDLYKDDLYVFDGDKIQLLESIYGTEQFQRYGLEERPEIKELENKRKCPKCSKELDVWEVVGFTKEDGTTTPSELYGFCDNCVHGFNFKKLTKEEKQIEKDMEDL